MSTPEATGTRQRVNKTDGETENPASLSTDSKRKVPQNKPAVKPPFADVSFGRFMTYLVMALAALGAFYGWRFTVWAAEAGGYWNLITGRHAPATRLSEGAINAAAKAASKAKAKSSGSGSGGGQTDIESQIISLASALGIKPADLSSAIRPLIDPTAPNPAEVARREAELKAKSASGDAKAEKKGPGLLAQIEEIVLD
ncbi:hypothetical protein BD324DRAFT_627093 [Kockovaella imperatae]|uniref:Uncharacterized protein n=1 Tax=Kockovaella imperatae TaxID=4999 RepID=A0A1Y1UGZ3_9TREE|nr:hypothetical protein BD324DRAFT_627093 [Kockovaella imperatae]ORX36764.1 hypothetical protein BD324DRAFT_627093 [Kockovaella imperatae]